VPGVRAVDDLEETTAAMKCTWCLMDGGHEMSCPYNPVNK
jgi:hypothetical protein